jgi:hypothetical protein
MKGISDSRLIDSSSFNDDFFRNYTFPELRNPDVLEGLSQIGIKLTSLFWGVTQRRFIATDLSGQPIGPIFEDGTDMLSRNVGN